MNTIYLEVNQVPEYLRHIGGYNGKKFHAVVTENTVVPIDAGLWSGGSRDVYYAIEWSTGRIVPTPGQELFIHGRKEIHVTLSKDLAIVKQTQGGYEHLTFFIHPDNVTKMLPAPGPELTETEKLVLSATRSYKSSYGGKDRYQMARDSWEWGSDKSTPFPTRTMWDAAKVTLADKGLLDKRGAITVKGRNVK